MTRKKILLVLGMLFGLLAFVSVPYHSILQIYLSYSIFILFEIIMGIILLYSFDTTKVTEYSKSHPSFKTGINLLLESFRRT
ncbi:MAG: hypothetical protein ACFFDC_05790 [Promethearchaeota archaeon]